MTRSEQHQFVPINVEGDTPKQNYPNRRKRESVKNTKSFGNSKTPSPNKEYKILRRSPNNTAANTFCSGFPDRNSPRNSDKASKGFNNTPNSNLACDLKASEQIALYAGARFHNPPSPDSLPKPPTHWLNDSCAASVSPMLNAPFLDSMALQIKGLLNVQA